MKLHEQIENLLHARGFVRQGYGPQDRADWRTWRRRATEGQALDVCFAVKEAVWTCWISMHDSRGNSYGQNEMFELGQSIDELDQRLAKKLVEFDMLLEKGAPKPAHVSNRAVNQYLETAIWSSTNEDGEPLDREFSPSDFSPAARIRALTDMQQFIGAVDELLENSDESFAEGDLAHDFWLTRNGHGTGFWDRPERYGDFADQLSDVAKEFPEINVYVTDDGQLDFE